MNLLRPTPPPYDPLEWSKLPFPERCRLVCQAWAVQGYGTPPAVHAAYAIKVLLYISGWLFFCSFTPGLGGPSTVTDWWLEPAAFQKAILWSLMFEGLGLGCGSGPLTGRYLPPVGGCLYFLRPGTTKLSLFPRLFGVRRTWLDVLLYLAHNLLLLRALTAAELTPSHVLPLVLVLPILGVLDRTLFLAARAEHYFSTVVCFAFVSDWIAGAQAVQASLWLWAGVSKLTHHFPSVIGVMTSNSPLFGWAWLRKRMYRSYPDDLRPSRTATLAAHAGGLTELAIPFLLVFGEGGPLTQAGLILMVLLHAYITSNVPLGVPIEWNFMVVYGGFFLFGANAGTTIFDMGSPVLAVYLALALIVVPLLGNLFPSAVSFLLSMRYYAGNWPFTVWLFKGDSYRKLDTHLVKGSAWIYDQLDRFYDRSTSVGLVGKVLGFRSMHLHGRILPLLVPRMVENLDDYEYVDGEIVAGLVLGWNFGDGHLHSEQLLAAVQRQCNFEEGELRCLFVEAQPLLGRSLHYRIADAKSGRREEGWADVRELTTRQPWAAAAHDE